MQAQPAEMMTKLAALTKNVLLAHGKAVRVLRSRAKQNPQIGMALNAASICRNRNRLRMWKPRGR